MIVNAKRDPANGEFVSTTKPAYYRAGGTDVLKFVQEQGLNFARGNIIKYVCRAGRKDSGTEIEDLEKAAEYLRREIAFLKQEEGPSD